MGVCGSKSAAKAYAPTGKDAENNDNPDFSNVCKSDNGVPPPEDNDAPVVADSFDAVLRPMRLGAGGDCDVNHALLIYDNPGKLNVAYTLVEKLGAGSYGSVHRAVKKLTGGTRAVKSIQKHKISVGALRQEITIMKMMDHPNIIKLFETFEDSEQIHLVMELCGGTDLRRRLSDVRTFTEYQVAVIMQQILRAVYFIHRNDIVHRDIKPENFMLWTDGPIEGNTLKLIDFGLSRHLPGSQKASTKCGTPWYMAPQVFTGSYDSLCDLWSCGVLMYFLLRHYHPFDGKTDNDVMNCVKKGNYSTSGPGWNQSTEMCKDLVRMLLKYKPHERFTAELALRHEFIQQNSPMATGVKFRPSLIAQFRSFCAHNRLKRGALHVIAQNLEDDDDHRELRETFTALDIQEDGVLTADEFEQGLSLALECVDNGKISAEELEEHLPDLQLLVTELAESGNAAIGYTEFLAATLDRRHLNDHACVLAFSVFDRNSDGEITRDELKNVFGSAPDVLSYLLDEIDTNFDGAIDFQEFKRMMQGEPARRASQSTVWQVKLAEAWSDFLPRHQDILHKAQRSGKKTVQLEIGGSGAVEVDLSSWIQTNLRTGKQREVRERQMYTRWQVQFATWRDCPDDQQELFTTARKSGQTLVDFTVNGTPYQADLVTMVQRNVRTKYERPLRLA